MRPGTLPNTRVRISAVAERLHRLRHKCDGIEHERDRAGHICIGGDGDCLHRDLFYHPIFDGSVKTRRDQTSKKPPPDLTTVTALTQHNPADGLAAG
jgi:hypothetical protein